MVTIRIPAPPRGLMSNLLGLLGLVAVVVAIGGLTHNWWWSLLAAGAAGVGLSYVAHLNAAGEQQLQAERDVPRLAAASRSA